MIRDYLVSIVMPVYNVEKYVGKCIESILGQTYSNIELIAVDDGSTDNSGKICDEYSLTDNRMIVYHKKNGGLSDARNYGLDRMHGQYVFFVDSDDYIKENTIECLVRAIEEDDYQLAICNFLWIDEFGNKVDDTPIKNESLTSRQLLEKLQQDGGYAYTVAWNKLYSVDLFNDIRFETGRIHEDEYIVHKIFSKVKFAISISQELYFYIKRNGSIVNSRVSEKDADVVYAYYYRYKDYERLGYREFLRDVAWQIWIPMQTIINEVGWNQLSNNCRMEFRKIFKVIFNELRKNISFTSLESRRIIAFRLGIWAYRLHMYTEKIESKMH